MKDSNYTEHGKRKAIIFYSAVPVGVKNVWLDPVFGIKMIEIKVMEMNATLNSQCRMNAQKN